MEARVKSNIEIIKAEIPENTKFYDTTTSDTKFIITPFLHEQVILPSFHRCGNTLTRELIEGITGIITGSDDNHTNYTFEATGEKNLPGPYLNFKSTYNVDNSVWAYKTHYPARRGKGLFNFDKIILITRNPFDAIDSMFNLFLTNTHTDSIKQKMYQEYKQEWEQFNAEQSLAYFMFHKFWLDFALKNNVPCIIVKYEDLIKDTKKEITNIIQFLIGYLITEGTIIEERITSYLNNRKLVYIPRKGSSYHSLSNYTSDMFKTTIKETKCWLEFCGYHTIFQKLSDYQINFNEESNNINYILPFNKNLNIEIFNSNSFSTCLNLKYPFKDIEVPRSIKNYKLDSDDLSIDYCNNIVNRVTINKLSKEISPLIEKEKSIDMNKIRKIFKESNDVDIKIDSDLFYIK